MNTNICIKILSIDANCFAFNESELEMIKKNAN